MRAHASLRVRTVRNGRGLVATRAFRRGAIILEFKGSIVTADELWHWWRSDPRRAANCLRYDEDSYLDPRGQLGRFANHSCEPNAGIVMRGRRMLLKAIAPIATDMEITHDYSTLIGTDDVWRMRCNCGESACRRWVQDVGTLPRARLLRYKRLQVVPDFILATL